MWQQLLERKWILSKPCLERSGSGGKGMGSDVEDGRDLKLYLKL